MKSLRVLAALVAALTVTAVFAQEAVPYLQDLVGSRAVGADNALMARGYESLGGDKTDTSAYTYWRHRDSGECILVRTANDHVASIVGADETACQEATRGRREPVPYLQDLLGERAVDGGTALMARGYDSLASEDSETSSSTYWRHRGSGECIVVRADDDRVVAILGADETECEQAAREREPVPHLQDLVGNRAIGTGSALAARGYESFSEGTPDTSAYTYWRHRDTGECIVVRTEDGHVGSILRADDTRCRGAARVERQASAGPSAYETLCGITVGGETDRYLCEATVFHEDGSRSRTVVRYPDLEITFNWQDDRTVSVRIAGTEPRQGTFSISEGTTSVVVEDRTYFFISDIGMAEREVRAYKRGDGN